MRKYYIDWLKIGGIFLLFPFHTARIFDFNEPNYIQDVPNVFSTWFIISSSFWFMPLLFLLAGMTSYYALKKRSGVEYAKERVFRLLIPLIMGIIIIVPPQGYFSKLQHFAYSGNYFDYLKSYFVNFSDLSGYRGTFTPAHLWFILYLFIISILLLPLMKSIKKHSNIKIIGFLQNPVLLLSLFIPLTLSEALPSIGGKNMFYYGLFFLIGYIIATNEAFFDTIRKIKFPVFIACIVLIPSMFYLSSNWGWPHGINPKGALTGFLRNLNTWLWLLVLLGYGEKYLNRGGKALSYLNQAAFPVYILHQSIMMGVAYYIVKLEVPFTLKFILIAGITLAGCLVLYEAFKRFKATRFLLGIK